MKIKTDIVKDIIYEDKDIIVCHKKPGMAVQTGRLSEPDMESALKNYLKSPYIGIIHRLDQPVEGLLVFAKNQSAAGKLSKQNQERAMSKKYYAVTAAHNKGVIEAELQKEYILSDFLVRNNKTNTSAVADEKTKDAKKAQLTYRILQVSKEETALVQVILKTGRHHQIRVQLANAGIPILGDNKYGSGNERETGRKRDIKNIALCAYNLSFFHPTTNKKKEFVIEPEGEVFLPFLPINP